VMRSNASVTAVVVTSTTASLRVAWMTARTLWGSTMRTAVTMSTPASAAIGMRATSGPATITTARSMTACTTAATRVRVANLAAIEDGDIESLPAPVYARGYLRTYARYLGLDPDEPFVLCLGRVERAKGSEALAALWRTYAERRSGAGRLVFLGPDHETRTEPAGGPVVRAGRQPDEVKWGALAACELLIAPSAQESFSLVVLEAWLAGRPVLVNGRCGPTVEHCRRSGGGVWFEQYGDFEAGLDRLLGDPSLRHEMGARGGAYARREFAWPRILDRYEDLARTIVGRRG